MSASRLILEKINKATNSTTPNFKNDFMHDMHKIAMDVTLTQMTTKKGIKIYNKR